MPLFAVLGAGNGGQTTAADLAIQGQQVRLFEFAEFSGGLEELARTRTLTARGAIEGTGTIDMVTTDLAEAVRGAATIVVCTQAGTHERCATELAPLVTPDQTIVLNPGSTGGALKFARVFREQGLTELPVLVELGTLTYGTRAKDGVIDCSVKVDRVTMGSLPATAIDQVAPPLEALFPGLVRARSVLDAGLTNANPCIHPPISLLNAARFENEGAAMFFYKDGVSPTVAKLIEKLDRERMALMQALGYEPITDAENSKLQGYSESDEYFECYAKGSGYAPFRSPDTLDHRYFHEDMGLGLVLYGKLGEVLGVPTPVADAFVAMGSVISDRDYATENGDILARLGIDGLDADGLRAYLETGERS